MRATVIGAGLAGCEAAYSLAERGYEVLLYEQKPERHSAAHKNDGFAELVCSNSLKAAAFNSAAGLLKHEMRMMGSLLLRVADRCTVPAGGALAVDRELFSRYATEEIFRHPRITVIHEEAREIDDTIPTIIATGPLTDGALAKQIKALCGEEYLSFYDAAAPIVFADSIDYTKAFAASRYNKGEADYLNCCLDREQYDAFVAELVNAEVADSHDGDGRVYEACMPIERLAKRGRDAIRYGPLKPIGIWDPETGKGSYAVVQLRRENAEGTLYNLVGFQTNLKFGEQKRVFSMITALENARFARYGVMHRNTFLNSPHLLNPTLNLKSRPNIYFAGQITGFEGYMESAACGLLAARFLSGEKRIPSENTMCGALLRYITAENEDFQPMGATMGLLPPLGYEISDKKKRYLALAERARADMEVFIDENCS